MVDAANKVYNIGQACISSSLQYADITVFQVSCVPQMAAVLPLDRHLRKHARLDTFSAQHP